MSVFFFVFLQLNHSDFIQRNGLSDIVPHISNYNNSQLVSLDSSLNFVNLTLLFLSPLSLFLSFISQNLSNVVIGSSRPVF